MFSGGTGCQENCWLYVRLECVYDIHASRKASKSAKNIEKLSADIGPQLFLARNRVVLSWPDLSHFGELGCTVLSCTVANHQCFAFKTHSNFTTTGTQFLREEGEVCLHRVPVPDMGLALQWSDEDPFGELLKPHSKSSSPTHRKCPHPGKKIREKEFENPTPHWLASVARLTSCPPCK